MRRLDPGRELPALCELAGETPPYNFFEIAALADRAFEELGVEPYSSKEEAAVGSASVRCRRLLGGEDSAGAVLSDLQHLCTELDELDALYDFYLLFFAKEQLRQADVQVYWPDATPENIDEIIETYCRRWLQAHPIEPDDD